MLRPSAQRHSTVFGVMALLLCAHIGNAHAAPPPTPTQLAPASGSNVPGTAVSFEWDVATGATDYFLEITDDQHVVFGQWVGNITHIILSGFPENGRLYFWRVAAGNALESSPFSSAWVFTNGVIQCGDERDIILQEYIDYHVNLRPTCTDFASSGGTAHFTWRELNGGFQAGNPHHPWGLVSQGLTDALEATRTNYNRGGIRLTSGYRCPHGNARVSGAPRSFHMHGRAADMYSANHPWTEEEFLLLKQAAERTTPRPIESFDWNTYPDHHYHAAW
jgi:hypothetical protein